MQKPLTPTQELLAAYYATRPAFVGPVQAQQLPGRSERQTAKRQLVKRASGK